MPTFKKRDIIVPTSSKHQLVSGCSFYSFAVVMQVDPLILISEDGDMRWNHISPKHIITVGVAGSEVYINCLERFIRDLRSEGY